MKMPLRDKILVVIIIFLLGVLWGLKAQAAMPDDIMDAKQVSHVVACQTDDGVKQCALAQKADKIYRIVFDEEGVYMVDEVTLVDVGSGWMIDSHTTLYERGKGI